MIFLDPLRKLGSNLSSASKESEILCRLVVRVFYLLVAVEASFMSYGMTKKGLLEDQLLLWPIALLYFIPHWLILSVSSFFAISGSLLASMHLKSSLWRIVACLGLFFLMALRFSDAKIDHSHHMILWCSLLLALTPAHSKEGSKENTDGFFLILGVKACQFFILFFYSLAGMWKLLGAALQIFKGEIHSLHPDAFAHQIAKKFIEEGDLTFFGSLILERPWLGFLPYLLGLYVETASVFIAFRPNLHRIWGFLLICFHIGTLFTLGIPFRPTMMVVALFLVSSPFQRETFKWESLEELPGIKIFRCLSKHLKLV